MTRRVLLLCGGRSGEHEVSLASAASVIEAVHERVDMVPLVIGRDGRRLGYEDGLRALSAAASGRDVGDWVPEARSGGHGSEALAAFETGAGSAPFDAVFPLLHGPYGEDGTVQGWLELVDVPYVGSGVLGSAVGMDKPTMKDVFAARGFPQVGYRVVTRARFETDPDAVAEALGDLAWPRYVKPANLGSSVGIARASTPAELVDALHAAFEHDRRAIVEESVEDARELEVAVLGNDDPAASPVGEIRFDGAFYDYATKYTEGAAELVIPADVPPAVAERCRRLAVEAFEAVDAAGLARVDFFWRGRGGRADGDANAASGRAADGVVLNEINTMPGFTRTSMYPKLWQAAGLGYPDLIERLIELALERHG